MRKLILLINCLIGFSLYGQVQTLEKATLDQIADILELKEKENLPGGALLLLKGGHPIHTQYFGLSNLSEGTEIDKKTLFHLNFFTQDFIALATRRLEAQGLISLDDNIIKYIPELPRIAKTITIEHLLEHTSGLYDYWALKSLGGWDYDDVFKKQQAFEMLSKFKRLNNPPGGNYIFSNTNYFLLAELIRRISGNNLNEVLRQQIFEPLNMKRSFVSERYAQPIQNKALYYFDYGDGHQTSYAKYGDDSGSVGLYATLNDLQQWLQFLQTEKLFRQLPSTKHSSDPENEFYYQDAYYFGYRGFIAEFPNEALTIALLSNDYYFNTHDRGLEIAALLSPKKLNEKPAKDEPASLTDLMKITGSYWDSVEMHAKHIELRNDTLYYQTPRGWSSALALENGKFSMVDSRSDRSIRFFQENGKMQMTIYTNGLTANHYAQFTPAQYDNETLESFTGKYYSDIVSAIYSFTIREGYLVATNLRTEDIILDPLTKDVFASEDAWYFSTVRFSKDAKGQITGFYLNTPEVKDLWFEKLDLK